MFDELFNKEDKSYEWQTITDKDEIKNILNNYIEIYSESDDKETWFNKIKEVCDKLGYASDMKTYKENPDNFKGSVADVSTVIRVAVTTKCQTPDLYEILRILGKERVKERFNLV
jgi:glutamyl-tRNA synthetase